MRPQDILPKRKTSCSDNDAGPHWSVHELTFLQEEDGSFSRHDEVYEERTYEVLIYDILLSRLASNL